MLRTPKGLRLQIGFFGKRNAGKSSLVNCVAGEERSIVSSIAGTTRDAIDSYFENETGKYCFIDTAGMRRKSKVDDIIEKYSNMRTVAAIERADVCLILIDANDGVTEQDTKIAGYAHEQGKACIIAVNKWDLVEKDGKTLLNKKSLDGFMKFATEEARKIAEKGSMCACVDDATVFGWAVHYFEEDSIIEKLYNQDGTEYVPQKASAPKKEIKKPEPKKSTPTKSVDKPKKIVAFDTQMSLFDF